MSDITLTFQFTSEFECFSLWEYSQFTLALNYEAHDSHVRDYDILANVCVGLHPLDLAYDMSAYYRAIVPVCP